MAEHIWIPSNSDRTRSCPKCGLSFNRKSRIGEDGGKVLQDVREAMAEAEVPADCDEELVRQVMES